MSVFVLMGCLDKLCRDVIGVFDHADITDDELAAYFGEFSRTKFTEIRGSGVEWILTIDTVDGHSYRLVLHEYTINEI